MHLGKRLVVRVCAEWNSKYFATYIAATGASSRGASMKRSIVVFTIRNNEKMGFLSCCYCVRGTASSCAHRARIICFLADQLFPSDNKQKSAASIIKNLGELGEAKPAQKQCIRAQQGILPAHQLQELLRYLPEEHRQQQMLTREMLKVIFDKLKRIAASLGKAGLKWPRTSS